MIDPALYSSNKTDWQTPPDIFEPLHREFDFTIDAAASAENALCARYWTIEDDALSKSWAGERVWCNPPYGREQVDWIEKAAQREADIAVLLIPARTDTAVWHDFIFPLAEVRFRRGRIKFVGAKSGSPFPSAFVIFRKG